MKWIQLEKKEFDWIRQMISKSSLDYRNGDKMEIYINHRLE